MPEECEVTVMSGRYPCVCRLITCVGLALALWLGDSAFATCQRIPFPPVIGRDTTKASRQPQTGAPRTDTVKAERPRPKPNPIKELQLDLDAIFASREIASSFVGVVVYSPETGEYLYRRNDSKNFLPASTLKLFTSAAALEMLGKDFRYATRLYLDGETLPNGEFQGNIIVRASGDPTMSSFFFNDAFAVTDDFARILDSLGIRSIRGNIIGDDSYFDNQLYGPGWAIDDIPYSFSAPVSALSINDNKVQIVVQPGLALNDPARIAINPPLGLVKVINSLTTVGPSEERQISVERDLVGAQVELRGQIPMESLAQQSEPDTLSVTVPSPTLLFLQAFRKALERRGIRARGSVYDIDEWNEPINYLVLEPVYEHWSPPLSRLISVVNKHSHNLAAEMLLKTIGKEATGYGTFSKGVEQVRRYCSQIGIAPDAISIVDGSGLSRLNLVSPQHLLSVLNAMYHSENRQTFMESLSEPGAEGTLRNRMTKTRALGNLRAKTGSLNNVSSLAGYVKTRDNESLSFVIMINGYTAPDAVARNIQDLVCMRLASFGRK